MRVLLVEGQASIRKPLQQALEEEGFAVDTAGSVGQTTTSITLGADGLGLISYYDTTNADLKVLHCSNTLCQPFVRRR